MITLMVDNFDEAVESLAPRGFAPSDVVDGVVDDSEDVQRAHAALHTLVVAAQASGDVRDDLTIDDFYLLVSNAPADQVPAALERWVDLILHGIAGPGRRR
jgi:hypothetical protein